MFVTEHTIGCSTSHKAIDKRTSITKNESVAD